MLSVFFMVKTGFVSVFQFFSWRQMYNTRPHVHHVKKHKNKNFFIFLFKKGNFVCYYGVNNNLTH